MKIIEKLSADWAHWAHKKGCGSEFGIRSLSILLANEEAFKAGFRAAREMAAQFMKSKTQHDQLFVPGHIDQILRELGEEEVKE